MPPIIRRSDRVYREGGVGRSPSPSGRGRPPPITPPYRHMPLTKSVSVGSSGSGGDVACFPVEPATPVPDSEEAVGLGSG